MKLLKRDMESYFVFWRRKYDSLKQSNSCNDAENLDALGLININKQITNCFLLIFWLGTLHIGDESIWSHREANYNLVSSSEKFKKLLLFSGNDYLGLSSHPTVGKAAARVCLMIIAFFYYFLISYIFLFYGKTKSFLVLLDMLFLSLIRFYDTFLKAGSSIAWNGSEGFRSNLWLYKLSQASGVMFGRLEEKRGLDFMRHITILF